MAREEIIDLGIKLDDAKEIIEERLKPTPSLQVQFGETEALIEEKDKIIGQLESKVKARDKELNANDDHIEELETKLGEKDKTIAELKDRVDKLGKTNDNLRDQRDEWKQDAERITGLKACITDLEKTLAFKNQTIVNLEGAKAELQKYEAELANGDGQDTSIDEQVANNQPYREGDE